MAAETEEEVAPRTRSLVMLSISIPVSLATHKKGQQPGPPSATLQPRSSHGYGGQVPPQIKQKHQDTQSCLLSSRLRRTAELLTFRLPDTKTRIAPVFDPFRDCTPFTCSIEILEPSGVIPKHTHEEAFELFVVLSGSASIYLSEGGGERPESETRTLVGDTMLVKPKTVHSITNTSDVER